jgi:hypothetical protein
MAAEPAPECARIATRGTWQMRDALADRLATGRRMTTGQWPSPAPTAWPYARGLVAAGEEGIDWLRQALRASTARPTRPTSRGRFWTSGRAAACDPPARGDCIADRAGSRQHLLPNATADRAGVELRAAGSRPYRDTFRGREVLTASELRVCRSLRPRAAPTARLRTRCSSPSEPSRPTSTRTHQTLDIQSGRELSRALTTARTARGSS